MSEQWETVCNNVLEMCGIKRLRRLQSYMEVVSPEISLKNRNEQVAVTERVLGRKGSLKPVPRRLLGAVPSKTRVRSVWEEGKIEKSI